MDKFDESHGLSKVQHPFDRKIDHQTRDWSKQRVAIGTNTERNLLELTGYRALLKELGLSEIFSAALLRCEQPFDATPASDYLVRELGFRWEVARPTPADLALEDPNEGE